jgi:hypothetical protein
MLEYVRNSSNSTITKNTAGHLWLMPVILAAQEADIRRITVQGPPGKKQDPTSKNAQHKKELAE